ncbi:GH15452 [Drosophila grimshawi]|uniref:GH15452 n=1 Tax=Drosophila grimshawi TaxID=7222 RepID=B4J2D9_DROGR|nr:GH15452 [Drosophila grimshawi]
MTDNKSHEKLKEWQKAACTRREADARRAGIGTYSVDFTVNTTRNSKRPNRKKRKDTLTEGRESQLDDEEEQKDLRNSMRATRIGNHDEGIDLCYHKPIVVRFKSKSDVA